jgi:mortality factor 4-like protein 1
MSFLFQENEKVLCFHGPMIYEAKVLKQEKKPESDYFFVHYSGNLFSITNLGWKKTWDEWVPEARILKLSEENLKKQADLMESAQVAKSKSKSAADKKPEADKEKNKKRRRDSIIHEREEAYMQRPEIKMSIPEPLKLKLVEDWESITKCQQLVALPRNPTVSQILNKWREEFKSSRRNAREGRTEDVINEIVEGLKLYFDGAVGKLLLYRFEKQQFLDILAQNPETKMSDIYGAEHLLRLFGIISLYNLKKYNCLS